MVKAEIRPPSSSAPELLAGAIKHRAAEGAVGQGLPITPCRGHGSAPGPQRPAIHPPGPLSPLIPLWVPPLRNFLQIVVFFWVPRHGRGG